MAGWTIDVSATTSIRGPGGSIDLRGKERAIVAALALHHPDPATAASLAPLVWGDAPPATAVKSIHNHVSRIRREVPELIRTSDLGYHLDNDVEIDSSGAVNSYADLADQPQVTIARARDRNRSLHDAELRIRHHLRSGSSREICDQLQTMVDAAPHRLIRWWWLAVMTARLGCRRDALEVLRACRRWHASGDADTAERRAIAGLEQAIVGDDVFIDSPAALAPESFGADSPLGGGVDAGGAVGISDPTGIIEQIVRSIDSAARTTLVVAPAGGGKTSTVRSIISQLPPMGWHCFHASCSPIETNPLQPITDLLAHRQEREGTDTDPSLDRRPAGGSSGDHAIAMFAALTKPANRRVLLIVDDAHHADAAMTAYLDQLVAAVEQTDDRIALLVTTRRNRLTQSFDQTIELPPWDAEAVGRYLRAYATPGIWSDGAAEWIAAMSRGNPLAARELVVEALRIIPDDPTSSPFVPPSRAVEHDPDALRVRDLGDDAVAAMQAAAVLGDEFRRSDLARLLPGSATAIALAEARGLVEDIDDDRCQFVHQTFRDSFLDTLEDAELISLSQRVAAAIRGSADHRERIGELAHFARSAASRDPEFAIAATLDEAHGAFQSLNFEVTFTSAQLAMELIEAHEGRSARWCAASVLGGKVGIDIGAPEAVDLLAGGGRRAIELGEHDIVGEATWALCALSPITTVGTIGDIQQELLDHALAHVTDPGVRARACMGGSFAWALADDPAMSRKLYFEAEEMSRRSTDPAVRADVLLLANTPLSQTADVLMRRKVSAELHELGVRHDRIEYTYEACRLDFSDAIHWGSEDPRPPMQRIEEIAAQLRQRGRNWSLVSYRATVALLDGDFELAEQHTNVLLTDEVTASEQLVMSTYGAHMIAIRNAQGRVGELDPVVADLVEQQPELEIWRAVRSLTAADSDPDTARVAFDSVFGGGTHTIPPSFTLLSGLVVAGEGAHRLGDEQRMREMVGHLTPFADRWAWFNIGTMGPVDLTLARLHRKLGEADAARRCAIRGLRSTSRVRAPHFAAQLAGLLTELD